MADAADSKSVSLCWECGFKSHLGHLDDWTGRDIVTLALQMTGDAQGYAPVKPRTRRVWVAIICSSSVGRTQTVTAIPATSLWANRSPAPGSARKAENLRRTGVEDQNGVGHGRPPYTVR